MNELDKVFGLHAVQAMLKTAPHRIHRLYFTRDRSDARFQKVLDLARRAGVTMQHASKTELTALVDGAHQGIIAEVERGRALQETDLYELIERVDGDPFILVLDGVTDPHNLGACLRSADAAGVHAVIIPKDNSVGLTETARKVASGAAETVPLVSVIVTSTD